MWGCCVKDSGQGRPHKVSVTFVHGQWASGEGIISGRCKGSEVGACCCVQRHLGDQEGRSTERKEDNKSESGEWVGQRVGSSQDHLATHPHGEPPFPSLQVPSDYDEFFGFFFLWLYLYSPSVDDSYPNTNSFHQSLRVCWAWPCNSSSISLEGPEAPVKLVFYHPGDTYSCFGFGFFVVVFQHIQPQHLYFLSQISQNYLWGHSLNSREATSKYSEHSLGERFSWTGQSCHFCGNRWRFKSCQSLM